MTDKNKTEQQALEAYEEFRKYVLPHWDRIKDVLVNSALAGDAKCLELIQKAMLPPLKPAAERVKIPLLASAVTMEEKAEAVAQAVAAGECSAEAGEKVMSMLAGYSRAADHEDRLRALEGRGPKRLSASVARKIEAKLIEDKGKDLA